MVYKRQRLVIKEYRASKSVSFTKSDAKTIVVGYSHDTVNGRYLEKLGVYYKTGQHRIGNVNLERLGYWLNRGATMKQRASWLVGLIGEGEKNVK